MYFKVLVMCFLVVYVTSLPSSYEKKEVENSSTRKPVRYCHYQTPCAWVIYNYSDYAEISLNNEYCVCRATQKCKFYERRASEGYSEYRCMRA